tara:strand:- start:49 stop:3717 length:3669 start_codon:yes stop_codon:yes gene_type:complete
MKKIITSLYLICFVFHFANAQNDFTVNVNNIKDGDSVRVIVQKSSESLFKKWIKASDSPTAAVFSLSEGTWAVKLDATGYTYPSQQVVNIPNDTAITFGLTELVGGGFSYTWEDDGSAAGHATQRYVNEPPNIVILNDTLTVPDDYSAIKLRTEYGVILSNDKETWSSEDSYRLYQMFESLPYRAYGEHDDNNYSEGEGVRGIFYLTDLEQDDDLSIELVDGVKHATFSQNAFVYSEPMIGTLDGIKGKFFSKRLYHAIVKFVTNFAQDDNALAWIAREKFGIEFLSSTQQTEELMGEDSSNFQAFFNTEKLEILSMLEELPGGFHKQDGLKFMVRRINGQDNPQYPSAAAIAWTGLNVIEFMSKAFISSDINDTRRLILHEKAHFLWAYTFDNDLKNDWIEIGGWYEDPTSASGWSTTNTTESVSAYAHLKSPNEDMAESIAFYLTNPDALMSVSMQKFEFIRDRVMHGTRYIAQIREDLTFTVYNLYPDYTYPGKVTKVEVDVVGGSEEDKLVTIRATLNSSDPELDGASGAYIRFTSGSGTLHDIGLSPENGQQSDSVLVGTTTFNKFEKSGYWNLSFFKVTDPVGNMRYENRSSVGMKLYIENPLEDITPPKYNDDYNMELVTEKFSVGSFGSNLDENGVEMRAIKLNFSHYDKIPISRSYARMNVPNNNHSEVYNRDIQMNGAVVDSERGYDNDFDSDKHFELYLPIHEYYQSGWYSTTYSFATDIAGNKGTVYHVVDTTDFHISENDKHKIFKHTRDSIFVETLYPDYKKPEIDINNISITAEPTNPTAPDGETRVEIDILARDFSDFEGHESGVYKVSFTLRDPLGGIHGYQTGNSTMNNPDLNHHDANPQNDNEWRLYNFDLLLPKGSPPGQWGMASATVEDRAGNREQYSFVEYVRFDIIPSDIELTSPLEAEISDKVVNLDNLSSISATMSCSPCEGLNYVYTIYSLMGGNVVRGEGVFAADSIQVDNIDTSGVLDGVIKLTVQVTDSEDKLVATKSVEYTKDTVRPKSYYSRSNLENEGTSSLDDFLIDVVVESADVGGSYSATVQNVSADNSNTSNRFVFRPLNMNGPLYYTGEISTTEFNISQLDLSSLGEGYVEIKLEITDPNGNLGELPYVAYYTIEGNSISYVGTTLSTEIFKNDKNITLYPNPTSSKILIGGEFNKVRLYDLYGRELLKSTSNQLDLSNLPNNVYMIKLEDNQGKIIVTGKVIKN